MSVDMTAIQKKSLNMFESLAVFLLKFLHIVAHCAQSALMLCKQREKRRKDQAEGGATELLLIYIFGQTVVATSLM